MENHQLGLLVFSWGPPFKGHQLDVFFFLGAASLRLLPTHLSRGVLASLGARLAGIPYFPATMSRSVDMEPFKAQVQQVEQVEVGKPGGGELSEAKGFWFFQFLRCKE